jgi:hypothetical protein
MATKGRERSSAFSGGLRWAAPAFALKSILAFATRSEFAALHCDARIRTANAMAACPSGNQTFFLRLSV